MPTEAFVPSEFDVRSCPLGAHIESFLAHLRRVGYATPTLRKKKTIASAFARWLWRKQIDVHDLGEQHVKRFVRRSPRSKARVAFELSVVRPFLRHLHAEFGVLPPERQVAALPAEILERRYAEYLVHERGLSERSVCVYVPFIRDFLADRVARAGSVATGALDAPTVRDYLLAHIHGRSSEQVRLMATALRSFLRFLFLRGEAATDLSFAVPPVQKWSQAAVPTPLAAETVERILAATDRTTPGGRRDYAILLLLARLGLRAGEVVRLELGDIRWRTAEIVIRGKGRVVDRMPLLSDVGEALARYIEKDRGSSASRRVFLRKLAPRVGLVGPVAVGHVVRTALRRAGVCRSCRGAAHLFRHSLATRMIRRGASMTEISEVLRHRSPAATMIYAKVDFGTLRGVARRWPGNGGGR